MSKLIVGGGAGERIEGKVSKIFGGYWARGELYFFIKVKDYFFWSLEGWTLTMLEVESFEPFLRGELRLDWMS